LKQCTKCQQTKEYTEFGKRSRKGDGYNSWCKECARVAVKQARVKNEARTQIDIPEYKICGICGEIKPHTQYSKSKREKDGLNYMCSDCVSAKAQAYKLSGKKKESDKKYRTSDKGKATCSYNYKRRNSRQRDKSVFMITRDQWDTMVASCNGVCPYCNNPTDNFTLDHLTPISKGGKHVPENIIPCCHSCNASKQHRDVFEWLEYKGYAKVNYANDNAT
jgi:hypothetical protein